MKNFLTEKLNRIQEIMGVEPLVNEAAIPGLPGIIATVKRIASQAARAGRVFAGDAQEISDALVLLNRASGNSMDEFEALARLVKASPDFDNLITPSLVNLVNALPNGSTGLGYIDNFISNSVNQGLNPSQIISQVEVLVDGTFGGFPKGAKDILKQKFKKDINTRGIQTTSGTNWIIPGTNQSLPQVVMTPEEIVGRLRSMFAADPRAVKIISKAESQIKSFIPRNQKEALDILETNKQMIERLLWKTPDPKKWEWLKNTIKNNWATKIAMSFFVGLAVSSIFLGIMLLIGADISTPFCNLLRGFTKDRWTCKDFLEAFPELKSSDDEEGALN